MQFVSKIIKLKNDQTVELRPVTATDAEAMLEHLKITHTESYKNMNQSAEFWQSLTLADEQKILTDFANSQSKFMLVATFDTRIIGGLGFVGQQAEFTKHSGQIGMSIQQAFTNSGLGTAMLEYALQIAKDFDFHRVDLSVRTYNKPGIALYEKVGFKRIGLLKDAAFINGEYVDEYSYQLILDSSWLFLKSE
jgi:RimJ/RimL family protein N-acetyltransferase